MTWQNCQTASINIPGRGRECCTTGERSCEISEEKLPSLFFHLGSPGELPRELRPPVCMALRAPVTPSARSQGAIRDLSPSDTGVVVPERRRPGIGEEDRTVNAVGGSWTVGRCGDPIGEVSPELDLTVADRIGW